MPQGSRLGHIEPQRNEVAPWSAGLNNAQRRVDRHMSNRFQSDAVRGIRRIAASNV